jgi:glycosyltransferase involved in cell wall biosynthesis
MDLTAAMLVEAASRIAPDVSAVRVLPPFARLFSRLSFLGRARPAFNADRLWNRMLRYPRHARRLAGDFDAFHVADHSYAQLVHALPARRTGVFCHDLDAFRCLLEPERDPRPAWFRAVARRVLSGLRRAAVVFHNSRTVGDEILRHDLVPQEHLVHAPLGVAPEFRPAPAGEPLPGGVAPGAYLLHVGSCIPRKRIDSLLATFAGARAARPGLRLVQVGGEWTGEQQALIARLGIGDALMQLRGIDRSSLAVLYRGAALVLQPSDAEGFGLPVVEALACGAPVLSSDIPVLREVGGEAVLYCSAGDVVAWGRTATAVLSGSLPVPPVSARLAQAARFSWEAQARVIVGAYRDLLAREST